MVCLAPVYAGHLVDGRGKDLDPDAPMRKAAHGPMISEDLLGRVLFSHRTKRLHTKRSAYTYTLTPLLYCAHCGQPLRGNHSNDRYTYTHTKRCLAGNIRSYDVAALEDRVVALLGELTIPDELLAEIRAETMQRCARSAESDRVSEQVREVQIKLKKLLELYLEAELDKETYREQKAQLDLQAQQLERMRNAGAEDTEDILLRISTIGSIISRGTPAQQKDALRALFDRIDIDNEGRIVGLEPRSWAKPLFSGLTTTNPAGEAGSISSWMHDMPPRGFENGSCGDVARVRPDIAGTWLALVAEPPSQVWTDRTREIHKLREQGETLANIGQRFGLSAERVRQILLHEGQEVLDSVCSEIAPV